MTKKLDLNKLAIAVGGTVAISTTFKFNARLDKALADGYSDKNSTKFSGMDQDELDALYRYARDKRDYGESIMDSVPQDLLRAINSVRN